MWPFKRKQSSKHKQARPPCPYCMSNNTKVVSSSQVNEEPNYIKTWKGQRYITCRCSECGRDFYIEATLQNIEAMVQSDKSIIEDELMAAEEEQKRQADEEDDHRFRGNMRL